jgi:hypothetical protein
MREINFVGVIHCFVCFMLVSVFLIVIVEKSMWFIVVSMFVGTMGILC